MKGLRIAPLVLVLTFVAGFTACGGGSADDLAEQKAKLNEREARLDEIKELQRKQNLGTATAEDEARLAALYAELEAEGEDPEAAESTD